MSNFGKSEYWFRSAEYDLETARTMLETRRLLYVGFMCHQAIKKTLKGVFVPRKPEEGTAIHSQADASGKFVRNFERNEREAAFSVGMLSPPNIEAQYPLHKSKLLESLTVERWERMIQETEALFLRIRKKC